MTSILDPIKPPFADPLTAWFHDRYRAGGTSMPSVSWMGVPMQKTPTDLWLYQELIVEERPEVIIELGTSSGGSALFLADMMLLTDNTGRGIVVSVDWQEDHSRPVHDRLVYVTGDTRSAITKDAVGDIVADCKNRRFLILDACHDYQQVKVELDNWVPMLRKDDILIVEDTDLGGPAWGLELFIKDSTRELAKIQGCDKFMLTYNPDGYWRMLN